jgi:hypothetical protein
MGIIMPGMGMIRKDELSPVALLAKLINCNSLLEQTGQLSFDPAILAGFWRDSANIWNERHESRHLSRQNGGIARYLALLMS